MQACMLEARATGIIAGLATSLRVDPLKTLPRKRWPVDGN